MHPRLKYYIISGNEKSEEMTHAEILKADKTDVKFILEGTINHINNQGGAIEFPYYTYKILLKDLSPSKLTRNGWRLINKFEENYGGNWSTNLSYQIIDKLGIKKESFLKNTDPIEIYKLFNRMSLNQTIVEYDLKQMVITRSKKVKELESQIEKLKAKNEILVATINKINNLD